MNLFTFPHVTFFSYLDIKNRYFLLYIKAEIFDMHMIAFVKTYIKLGYNVTNFIRVAESVGMIKGTYCYKK